MKMINGLLAAGISIAGLMAATSANTTVYRFVVSDPTLT